MRTWLALLLAFSTLSACATYREDLNRGERLYDNNEYDRALAIWRYLEHDMDSLEWQDQARYAYLRGMTDYRLNFRPDARHWLALAKAIDEKQPGALQPQLKERLEQALADLNKDVFGGAEQLANSRSTSTEKKSDLAAEPAEPPKPGSCSTNADCSDGLSCQSGECVPL
jgi:hypothetical protein